MKMLVGIIGGVGLVTFLTVWIQNAFAATQASTLVLFSAVVPAGMFVGLLFVLGIMVGVCVMVFLQEHIKDLKNRNSGQFDL